MQGIYQQWMIVWLVSRVVYNQQSRIETHFNKASNWTFVSSWIKKFNFHIVKKLKHQLQKSSVQKKIKDIGKKNNDPVLANIPKGLFQKRLKTNIIIFSFTSLA